MKCLLIISNLIIPSLLGTIIGRWSLMYRPRCSRHVLLAEPVRRIFSFFRPAKPRGEQAIYTIKIMERHSPYTALLIFNKRLCTVIIRFRFSAQGAYLLLVPQGRALIPFFFFRETTECSKQNLNTVFIKKKDNNKKPEQ